MTVKEYTKKWIMNHIRQLESEPLADFILSHLRRLENEPLIYFLFFLVTDKRYDSPFISSTYDWNVSVKMGDKILNSDTNMAKMTRTI